MVEGSIGSAGKQLNLYRKATAQQTAAKNQKQTHHGDTETLRKHGENQTGLTAEARRNQNQNLTTKVAEKIKISPYGCMLLAIFKVHEFVDGYAASSEVPVNLQVNRTGFPMI